MRWTIVGLLLCFGCTPIFIEPTLDSDSGDDDDDSAGPGDDDDSAGPGDDDDSAADDDDDDDDEDVGTAFNTIVAASCEQADVREAVNLAFDGDIVAVPSGTCDWTGGTTEPGVEITKSITLAGAGIDETVIRDRTGSQTREVMVLISAPNARVTGFTFADMPRSTAAEPGLVVSHEANNFRVDHCKFDASSQHQPGRGMTAAALGVVDHCVFIDCQQGVAVFGGNDKGHHSWTQPLTLGTANAVYVEDNEFIYSEKFDGAMDAYGGARYVFRYNTVLGTKVAHHGLDSGNYRSTFSYEIYNNTFHNESSTAVPMAIRSRGGTGVVFDNVLTGNYHAAMRFIYYRSCNDMGGWGQCDGANALDGNQDASGYPCQDQPGRTTNQQLSPAYEWNNTLDGDNEDIALHDPWGCSQPSMADHIEVGRDYFNDTPRPGYTPYQYPHPLTMGEVPAADGS